MILVCGLGNPGPRYETTRHNIGFLAADFFAENQKIEFSKEKFQALYAAASFGDKKILVAKPQAYMNLSGQAIRKLADFYKISPQNIIVFHDDIELPFQEVRMKHSGGHAGHNGIKSLIEHLNTDQFHRIRMGVGRPQNEQDVSDYVLSPFTEEELKNLPPILETACTMLEKTLAELN
ncbi:MAG: aminoacyl-tRNA hydrolase [Deltaproteobacteria bacterium RIFCSPHIGHO2_02_FULL_40_11]|nr:MAG: aminoacyl-tRNA hydrolase [Deltaproteobacteria bacterium RIFCSPHIGHO2_02_FULL_40_11]